MSVTTGQPMTSTVTQCDLPQGSRLSSTPRSTGMCQTGQPMTSTATQCDLPQGSRLSSTPRSTVADSLLNWFRKHASICSGIFRRWSCVNQWENP